MRKLIVTMDRTDQQENVVDKKISCLANNFLNKAMSIALKQRENDSKIKDKFSVG